MEPRPVTFFYLILVVNYFEDTRSELSSELAKDSIGFESLDNKVL